MIPILYEAGETEFKTNGLGRLTDAISCNVIEERNGTYELSMIYPMDGIHYDDIATDRIIYAVPADGKDAQPFRIYKISRPINGEVEIDAEHISYILSSAIVMPFDASGVALALTKLQANIVGADGFEFWTDKSTVASFSLEEPTNVRSALGGSSGSILDTYGGEYEFDKFTVKLHAARGNDLGVTIRYGKNMSDATRKTDLSNVYTGIVPYCTDSENDKIITLSEKVIKSEHTGDFAYPLYKTVDLTNKFDRDEEKTEAKLRTFAKSYIESNQGWEIGDAVKVEFVPLWQTDEYKSTASIERVNLCDTVHVLYEDLGINVTAKVIKTDYDVLAERYNSIEVGNSTTNLSKTINSAISDATSDLQDEMSGFPAEMKKKIDSATAWLTKSGGYAMNVLNADGAWEHTLYMDTNDPATCKDCLKISQYGIGFSHNGINGPFESAWTIDGNFVADYITSGTLRANLIKAGILSDELGNFYLDMASGELVMKNGSFTGIVDAESGKIGAFSLSQAALSYDKTGPYSENVATGYGFWFGKDVIEFGQNDGWRYCPVLAIHYSKSFNQVLVSALGIYNRKGRSAGNIGWDDDYDDDSNRGVGVNTHWFVKGDCRITQNCYAYGFKENSDRRLKQNIESIDAGKATEFIRNLQPVSFEFIEHPDDKRHGFIAQDVGGYDDWSVISEDRNYLTMDYIGIIADMVATIQSQDKRITALEERISKLEEALNANT